MKYLAPRVKRSIRLRIGLVITAVGAVASIGVAPLHADTLDSSWNADSDNTSAEVKSKLTDVCLGSSVTINVQGAVHRNGNIDKFVFANSSEITYQVEVGNGSDVPAGLNLGSSSATIPSDWVNSNLGTTRQTAVDIPVSFTPTGEGTGKLHLILRATGTAVNGTSLVLTHPVKANGDGGFSWSAKDCSTPPNEEGSVSLEINSQSLIVDEGQTAKNMFSASGTLGVTVTASSGTIVQNSDGTFTWSELQKDGPGDSKTVTLTATNGKGKAVSKSFSLTVNNVDPMITSTVLNVLPDEAIYSVGSPVTVSAKYYDPAALLIDKHTCETVWGDGVTTAGSVVNGGDSSTGDCNTMHIYEAVGVYSVSTTIFDKDGGTSQTVYGMVVIYDPSAGFVTGGGWINVAVGSDVANPSVFGKANFGFVSKYLPGRNTPDGNTEFQFQNGKLKFNSSNYNWLVVSGCKSQYRGVGSVNGVDGYGFYVVATDGNTGKCKSLGGVDKFRIKIWNADGVVFDNSKNSSDFLEDSAPQSIAGGNIVIHTKG